MFIKFRNGKSVTTLPFVKKITRYGIHWIEIHIQNQSWSEFSKSSECECASYERLVSTSKRPVVDVTHKEKDWLPINIMLSEGLMDTFNSFIASKKKRFQRIWDAAKQKIWEQEMSFGKTTVLLKNLLRKESNADGRGLRPVQISCRNVIWCQMIHT